MEAGRSADEVLYHNQSSVKLGELERYVITYELYQGDSIPADITLDSLWVKIKNTTKLSYKPAYLLGPFILYCDVRAKDYESSYKIICSADKPVFQSNLQAQQKFIAELSLHHIKPRYVWIVDIVSQILFNKETKITFEIVVGNSKASLKRKIRCNDSLPDKACNILHTGLSVHRLTTADIWKVPRPIDMSQKSHLVILTHGFQSNVSADMEYLMEEIYKAQMNNPNERLVIKGYMKNACETEKGIKFLGVGLANYIIDELYDDSVGKISFIGHSLGGLTQTFAICYIKTKYPYFFKKVEPINFISLASPLLGIATSTPNYVKMSLSMGIIGTTGQELGLKDGNYGDKPLLYLLSEESLISVLARFKRRTLYANAVNDGIVPLYSSSLLFLDYSQLLQKLGGQTTASCDPLFQPEVSPIGELPNHSDVANDDDGINASSWNTFWKSKENNCDKKFKRLMNASVIKSMKSVLLSPCPEAKFFSDPDARVATIIHDKIYTEKNLPPPSPTLYEGTAAKEGETRKTRKEMEEIIARRWHKGMHWRKVVVLLKPDAHNNIIVRRRFSNAYGWPVVDHLVTAHFQRDDPIALPMQDKQFAEEDINMATGGVEPNKFYSWLTKIEDPSVYHGGIVSTASQLASSWISKHSSVTD
ncbi:YDL109C-like putative lipase [Saccharomyces cerevisiae]|nr:ALH_1c_G0007950.mRNA.1.CDS.1 [Saccharomyces cerevisiae]CAI4327049.1 ALH_1b_G0007980.mRNA.1.CDS.1 [Saccharomyces cerevisiae]CAI4871380.1 AFH_G0007920.mRNA.1.CDS.1 [Saccharomyces cerevisiae]CAI5243372.1 AKR_HP2_G0008210.mRNA.1.CDS.1 [Saccharomyces cerevisiae]CAI6417458.1 AKR_HP2_G0008210.mRNA.1.CDS.1 [Saccharomyces cerevisiae]